MNVVTRGIKNTLRSPLRSGAIVLMLAISIGLILSMLVARSSVNAKITDIKASAGTKITITPAGVQGFSGGGNPLTSSQISTITKTAHISSTVSSLSDQLGSSDTNLTSSLELGSFGQRQQRFDSDSSSSSGSSESFPGQSEEDTPSTSSSSNSTTDTKRQITPRITVTGTTDPNSIATSSSSLKLSSGSAINGSSSDLTALVGSDLATKNNLKVGNTFTAYSKTITVKGIYTTGSKFQDSGLIMPLATVQTASDQAGDVTSVVATVDSSDNVSSTVSALKKSLGSAADITSEIEQANTSVSSLKSIASLATAGVIGATIAGAVIVLLAMIMIVRERRREIGVIKAIGGSNRKVIYQFITEALTLTIIGAIIGLIIGVIVSGPMTSSLVANQTSSSSSQTTGSERGGGMGEGGPARRALRGGFSQLQANATSISASLSPTVFLLAIGITFLIAIVGSAIPAWLIAKVKPAEVLRTE